jgi:DNA-directed RNA polymerase subunit RPC12/RpoP
MKALLKLADGEPIRCAICGCPHAEIMHIGHPEHRGGRWHRKEAGGAKGVIAWILKTPIEEVKERVQLECPYCNSWHNKFKEYPPEDKRPTWKEK